MTNDDLKFPPSGAPEISLVLKSDLHLPMKKVVIPKGNTIYLVHDGIHAYISWSGVTWKF